MARTLRPLSLGQLLDETFNIYRRHFLLFIGISALPNLALLLFQLALAGPASSGPKETGILPLLAGLVEIFAILFVSSIVAAATVFGVSDIYLETPTSMVACFSRVARKALKVIYVSFLVGLIITFGIFLCIAPGIYWAGVYGIAVSAVVLENITGNRALKRSSELTKGSVGRVILAYFLTYLFTLAMETALNTGARAMGLMSPFHKGLLTPNMLREINSTLSNVLFGPVNAIALTLVYYDQRVRKEAFDIEHMMNLMKPPEPLASGSTAS